VIKAGNVTNSDTQTEHRFVYFTISCYNLNLFHLKLLKHKSKRKERGSGKDRRGKGRFVDKKRMGRGKGNKSGGKGHSWEREIAKGRGVREEMGEMEEECERSERDRERY